MLAELVEQLTYDPEYKGLDQGDIVTSRKIA
jgi:hypothetical protein